MRRQAFQAWFPSQRRWFAPPSKTFNHEAGETWRNAGGAAKNLSRMLIPASIPRIRESIVEENRILPMGSLEFFLLGLKLLDDGDRRYFKKMFL